LGILRTLIWAIDNGQNNPAVKLPHHTRLQKRARVLCLYRC